MMIFFCEKKICVLFERSTAGNDIFWLFTYTKANRSTFCRVFKWFHPKHKIYVFSGLVHVFSFSVFVCLWMAHVEQSDSPSFINWRIAAMITTRSRCVLIIFAASYVYLIFILSLLFWNFTKLVFPQLLDGRRRCSTKVLIRLSSCFLLYTLFAYFYFFLSPVTRPSSDSLRQATRLCVPHRL